MALNIGALGGVFSGFTKGIGGFFTNALIWIIGTLIAGVIGFFVWKAWKNMTFYKTPVSLTVLRENGMEKTRYDLKGGVFWNKGIKDFKVFIPKSKPFILGYIPDFSKSTSVDGRIHFITEGDSTLWQQVEHEWKLIEERKVNGEIFEYSLINKPIPREIKQVTINSIKNWKETIDKTKLTAFTIAIGAFIIMVIAHLISLYIQTKIKCGVP